MFILALLIPLTAILIVYLYDRINKLQSRIDYLERLFVLLQKGQLPSATVQPEAPGTASPQPPESTRSGNLSGVPEGVRHPVPPPPVAPRLLSSQSTTAQRPPSRSRQEWEELVGGKLLNRVGALALVIGVGFFLKYAFDNNWISEPIRVLIGVAVGAGLLALGAYTHRKDFQIFSHGLVGAGIAILYLAVYASFNFYHLVSQPVAFIGMSVVTGVAFWQAMRYNASAVSLLAWAGGFLTPFLLASDRPNAVGLFGYLTLLNVAVLAITVRKPNWKVLSLLTLAGTYFTYTIWFISHGRENSFGPALLFLTLTWALFYASDVYRALKSHYSPLAVVQSSLNLFLWACLTIVLLDSTGHDWHVPIFIAATLAYGFSAFWLGRLDTVSKVTVGLLELSAVALLAVATYYQFGPFSRIAVWSVEAAALGWLGLRLKRTTIWRAALGLFGLAAVMLLFHPNAITYQNIGTYRPIINFRTLAYAALAVSLMVAAFEFRKRKETAEFGSIADVLNAAWFVVLFGLITVETSDYFRRLMHVHIDTTEHNSFMRSLVLLSLWAIYGAILLRLGAKRSNAIMIGCASIALAIAVFGSLLGLNYRPIEEFRLIVNLRVLAFLVLAAALYLHGRWLSQSSVAMVAQRGLGIASQVALMLVLLALVTAETWDAFGPAKARLIIEQDANLDALSDLRDLRQLTLSGVWLVYSVVLMVLGLWRRLPMLRIAAIGLFGLTILKIFIYDLSFLDTLYRIFSFIGLGLILLAVSYAYQRYKGIILSQPSESIKPE